MASPLQRIGILGDIHGEDVALERALATLAALRVDAVLAVGDIVDGPGDVSRCCALLEQAGALAVRGNHERWMLADEMRELPHSVRWHEQDVAAQAYLDALPATRTLETSAGLLLLCHGLGEDDMACVRPDDRGYALESNDALHALVRARRWSLVVNGHTHQRMVRRFGELTVVNAGTLFREHRPCFGVLDLPERAAQFYELPDGGEPYAAERLPLP